MYTLKAPSDNNGKARATSRPAANQPVVCLPLMPSPSARDVSLHLAATVRYSRSIFRTSVGGPSMRHLYRRTTVSESDQLTNAIISRRYKGTDEADNDCICSRAKRVRDASGKP